MSEELKPCPFCWQTPETSINLNGDKSICHLNECKNLESIKEWNSAWCWKEIDRLKESIKTKDEALKDAIEVLGEEFQVDTSTYEKALKGGV
jgi:hypothetical protein